MENQTKNGYFQAREASSCYGKVMNGQKYCVLLGEDVICSVGEEITIDCRVCNLPISVGVNRQAKALKNLEALLTERYATKPGEMVQSDALKAEGVGP